MAETIDDLELELEDKPPVEPEIRVENVEDAVGDTPKTDESPENREISAAEGLEDLKRKLELSESQRLETQRRAQQAERDAMGARKEVQDTNLSLVVNAIATLNQTSEMLEANYAEAAAAGDWAVAAKIQRQMATASAQLLQLEQGKIALENQPPPQIQRQAPDDPVEALAQQLSAPSANWVRTHPEFARDQSQFNRMLAAHNLAIGDGIAPDTPAYFEAIETTLRLRRPEQTSAPPQQEERRAAPSAAPVSRGPSTNGSRPNVVRLTAEQREAAEISGMTDEEYARQLLKTQREGQVH